MAALPYNFVSFHFNCEWLNFFFFWLFSDLFSDIKFLLVHTLCEWLLTYPLSSLFSCLITRLNLHLNIRKGNEKL